jgi:hypothetical protein
MRNAYKILIVIPEVKRPRVRSRNRWSYNFEMVLKGIRCEDVARINLDLRWYVLTFCEQSNSPARAVKGQLCSKTCSQKSCRLWSNVEKCGTAGQATDGNITRRMRFACWITRFTHTHTLKVCNTYCFYTVTMVTRTRLSVMFIPTLPVLLMSNLFVRLLTTDL